MEKADPTPEPETPNHAPPPPRPEPGHPPIQEPLNGEAERKRTLFDPETRSGRVLRSILRTLAIIVAAFGIGVLVAYIWLYRPVRQQLDGAQERAAQAETDLQKARADLEKANGDIKAAGTQVKEIQDRLDVELARVQVLRAMNELTNARMVLAADDAEAATQALDASQAFLEPVLPTLEKLDSAQLSTLTALYTLAKNDLSRDAALAAQDLDRLQSELELAEQNVLK